MDNPETETTLSTRYRMMTNKTKQQQKMCRTFETEIILVQVPHVEYVLHTLPEHLN